MSDLQDAVVIVYCTCPDNRCAEGLARALVEERLAACVNLLAGVRSFYRWQDRVEDDSEVLLLAKTQHGCVQRLCRRIEDLHPYDVPEIVAVPVSAGLPAYLRWVIDSTGRADDAEH